MRLRTSVVADDAADAVDACLATDDAARAAISPSVCAARAHSALRSSRVYVALDLLAAANASARSPRRERPESRNRRVLRTRVASDNE